MTDMDCFARFRPARIAAVLAACTLILGACVHSDCPDGECSPSPDPEDALIATKGATDVDASESVQAINFDGLAVNASVISTGCTTAANFHVDHEMVNDACVATLVRDAPDLCRRAPFVTELSIAWQPPQNCTISSVTFANPIVDLSAQLASRTPSRTPRSE